MNEMTFRRQQGWIIASHAVFVFFIIGFFFFLFRGESVQGLLTYVCLGLTCAGIVPAVFNMLNHAYDKIHLDAEGRTVTRFAFSKKKRTQEFLAWDNILRIAIRTGGRGSADFFVYRQDNTTILFQCSRRIYFFLTEVYPKEIENPDQIQHLL